VKENTMTKQAWIEHIKGKTALGRAIWE